MNQINYVDFANAKKIVQGIISRIKDVESDINILKNGRAIDSGYLNDSLPTENTYDGGEL